jgi:predicted dehydrogenase
VPTNSDLYPEILSRRIPVYPSLEELYRHVKPDLAVLSTPLHLHHEHVLQCLAQGSHVLCEKPLAASMNDVRDMIRARDQASRIVAIGYQWSFHPTIQRLKRDVAAGIFGRPTSIRTLVLWPRTETYYQRNGWAGRMKSDDGLAVLDSPLNNACAHFVHNALYVMGAVTDRSAFPTTVSAELYRANAIESFDTGIVRCSIRTEPNPEVKAIFIVSHAVPRRRGPIIQYEFENATITYDEGADPHDDAADGIEPGPGILARFNDGKLIRYGEVCPSDDPTKLWHTLDCIRDGQRPVCGIEASAAQTALICAAHASCTSIATFPEHRVTPKPEPHGPLRWVPNLERALEACMRDMKLPSEAGLPWAKPGKPVLADALDATG